MGIFNAVSVREVFHFRKNRRRNGKPVRARLEASSSSGANNTTHAGVTDRDHVEEFMSCVLRAGPRIPLLFIVSCFSG